MTNYMSEDWICSFQLSCHPNYIAILIWRRYPGTYNLTKLIKLPGSFLLYKKITFRKSKMGIVGRERCRMANVGHTDIKRRNKNDQMKQHLRTWL